MTFHRIWTAYLLMGSDHALQVNALSLIAAMIGLEIEESTAASVLRQPKARREEPRLAVQRYVMSFSPEL